MHNFENFIWNNDGSGTDDAIIHLDIISQVMNVTVVDITDNLKMKRVEHEMV